MTIENRDQTIAEIHRVRREIAARFQDDIFAITADAQARSEVSGRQIIRRQKPSTKVPHTGDAPGNSHVNNPSSTAG